MVGSNVGSRGIGFLGLLTILFIALKLTGYIDWNWWWVLTPIWAPMVIICIILICIGVGMLYMGIKGF